MFGYIYKTTNLVNGKIYVGKHRSPQLDESYLGSGIHLSNAVNYYGKENFIVELIDTAESLSELNDKEKLYIQELNARDPNIGYNIACGGDGGQEGLTYKHTEEAKQKIRDSWKTRSHTLSAEERAKIRSGYANMSEDKKQERSEKLKIALTGRSLPEDVKTKIGNSIRGQKRTPEQIANMCRAQQNRPATSEKTKEHLRTVGKGRIWINKDGVSKMIYPEEFISYTNLGWSKGRK